MNYLDLLKTVYTKQKLEETNDLGMCIALTKTLSKDKDNLPALKQVIDYLFYVEPIHYFYLLYFYIPQKSFIPRTIKFDKEKKEKDEFSELVQRILEFSDTEMQIHKEEINSIIENKKEWKKILGV